MSGPGLGTQVTSNSIFLHGNSLMKFLVTEQRNQGAFPIRLWKYKLGGYSTAEKLPGVASGAVWLHSYHLVGRKEGFIF